jgi:hypothetical protein
MRPLDRALFLWSATLGLATCQGPTVIPDVRVEILNPKREIKQSDIIVLAYPIAQQDIRAVLISVPGRVEPSRVEETIVTLLILGVLKGSVPSPELRFRYYDARSYAQIGAPQGPTGGIGSRGVFFLREGSQGIYRSAVDIYRPDIPTPWLRETPKAEPCAAPSDCVARLLLSLRPSDNSSSFAAHLSESVAASRLFAGVLETFEMLSELTADRYPEAVRRSACIELSGWYALELPSVCKPLVVGTPQQDYEVGADQLREQLKEGGFDWIRRRIGSDDSRDVMRYLGLLLESPDEQTRAVAQSLADKLP